jgi:DNA-binding NtrC family response regulator
MRQTPWTSKRHALNEEYRAAILDALKQSGGHRRKAASYLGMTHSHFYYWLDKLQIGGPDAHVGPRHRRVADRRSEVVHIQGA